jgi:hypothetical protein
VFTFATASANPNYSDNCVGINGNNSREHPDFANMQNYEKIYPFWGKPTLSFPKKSVLESMSHFIAIEE